MVISKMEFKIQPSQKDVLNGMLPTISATVRRIRGLEKWMVVRKDENTYVSMAFYRDAGFVGNSIPVLMDLLKEITPYVESISRRSICEVVMQEQVA